MNAQEIVAKYQASKALFEEANKEALEFLKSSYAVGEKVLVEVSSEDGAKNETCEGEISNIEVSLTHKIPCLYVKIVGKKGRPRCIFLEDIESGKIIKA